ncbi:hypothetical protein OG339_39595 [Streptosporangium sp. NBC_01495]|uniref:hypothetical protein n=1 Tax=Streptosporangium sp. NBC_01495 TaxID=2903899 RepID=UPI002E336932|nr:hypothetical protein [Streptosporangium sp. NBC_01495]
MNGAIKVGAYALGLAVVFGGALGAGRVAGPVGGAAAESSQGAGVGRGAGQDAGQGTEHGAHQSAGQEAPAAKAPAVPAGLQVSQGGYMLMPETDEVKVGKRTDFRFTVIGPDGSPVTEFTTQHDKKLHFIVVRRDLTGFQHLHPTQLGGGVWSVPLKLPVAGEYRAFADFAPEGAGPLTLGMDLSVAGDYRPEPPAIPAETAKVGDYTVTLRGDLIPGRTSMLTLSIAKDGEPVTDLQPYLAAYGHLVALRDGDLAYLHVHPDGAPGDGRTVPGPDITFYAEVPSAGTYGLYLDFKHAGTVRTAVFTAATSPDPEGGGATGPSGDGHGHSHQP